MKSKALVFAILLTLCYYFITVEWRNTQIVADQGQWSLNAIRAQKLLYDLPGQPYNCIVGTSLAARLVQSELPAHYFNLSFSAQGAQDGLSILSYTKKKPDTLFVEINYFSKLESKDFLEKIIPNESVVELRKHLPLLQERNLPLGVVANYLDAYFVEKTASLRNIYTSSIYILRNKIFEKQNILNDGESKRIIFTKMLNEKVEVLNRIPDRSKLEESADRIVTRLKSLEKDSVTLVFFEMPVDCSLENSALFKFNKEKVLKSFPASKYKYINNDGCDSYSTADGTHLEGQSAKEYTYFLMSHINK